MIKAILTDIEGTTSSLSFVKEVLFPYARAHIGDYVRAHTNETSVIEQLAEVSRIAGKSLSPNEAVELLIQWIDEDKKITPLKTLQGLIWQDGYQNGDFKGHIYEDAVINLKRWQQEGVQLYVFSSGSVRAQHLLFQYTEFGDLRPLFSGHFDTTIGNKREADAYRRIAEIIGLPTTEILFLSDIVEELDAAKTAGMATIMLARENANFCPGPHRCVSDFYAIEPGKID